MTKQDIIYLIVIAWDAVRGGRQLSNTQKTMITRIKHQSIEKRKEAAEKIITHREEKESLISLAEEILQVKINRQMRLEL